MSTEDIIIRLFCIVDDRLPHVNKRSDAHLYASEIVTIGLLFSLKGGKFRPFYRWLSANYDFLFPKLPERIRLQRLLRDYSEFTEDFLEQPSFFTTWEDGMLTFAKLAKQPTVLQALTGLSLEAFGDVLPAFVQAMHHLEQQADAQRLQPRERHRGGDRKPFLQHPADQFLFILFYFKVYPLQHVQAFFFGISQTQVCEWVRRLTPLLNLALGIEHHLPERKAATMSQVLRACPGLEFIIDGTERPIQRPKDKKRQRELYSGKKKRHTVKNVVIVDRRTCKIKALSQTRSGKMGDKRIADEEEYRFPARSRLWKDTGFQGMNHPTFARISRRNDHATAN
jgi:hypothetical protein